MELIVALGVVVAGATLALRSALSPAPYGSPPAPAPAEPVEDEVAVPDEPVEVAVPDEPVEIVTDEPTVAMDPLSDLEDETASEAQAGPDPDATLTAVAAVPPLPGFPAPALPALPAPAAPAPAAAAGAVAVAERTPVVLAITEDRALDEVLTAATEAADPPKHPALRLALAITALAVAFALTILGVARGIQAVFDKYFG